jgi:hypothetical protein
VTDCPVSLRSFICDLPGQRAGLFRAGSRERSVVQLPSLTGQPQGQLTIFADVAIDEVLQL